MKGDEKGEGEGKENDEGKGDDEGVVGLEVTDV